jgi:hypothetical protein
MIRTAIKNKSLSSSYFSLALLSFMIGVSLGYVDKIETEIAREWGDLISITLVLCGLFVKTRNSKPVFARFPLYMTLLPIIGILFYPMVNDAQVVKDLLQITYQSGAIVVGGLVIGINHLMYKQRGVLLIACFVFLAAFVLKWVELPVTKDIAQTSAELLLVVGMLLSAFGFKKISNNKPIQHSP